MISHERFGVPFLNTTMKAKFHVQNAFFYTLDWTLQISRLLRFRVAVDAKMQLMCVAERTLGLSSSDMSSGDSVTLLQCVAERTLNVAECLFEGHETLG